MRCAAILGLLLSYAAAGLTLSGTVEGPEGRPVAGAEVWLAQERDARWAQTAAAGRFHFSQVRPGEVHVVAYKEGYAFGGFSGRVADDGDIRIVLVEADEMKLRIVDGALRPVAGVRLLDMNISDVFSVPVADLVGEGFPSIRSEDDGFMTIPALPKHSFLRFNIDHPDYARTYIAYFAAGRPLQEIVIKSGEDLQGRVTDTQGNAIPNARVSVFSMTPSGLRELAEPMTDPEGFYHAKVLAGELYVTARHPDYAPSDPIQFQLRNLHPPQGMNIVMHESHLVQGKVVDERGKPAAGVDVAYIRKEAVYTTAITGRDGTYTLNVAPGPGNVYVAAPERLMVEGSPMLPIDVEQGTRITLEPSRLTPLPTISGTVRDRRGDPAPEVFLRSVNLEDAVWTMTDAEGRFSIQLDEVPFDEEVEFVAEHSLRFLRKEFTVDIEAPQGIDVRLKRYSPDLKPVREDYKYRAMDEGAEIASEPGVVVSRMGNDLAGLLEEPAPPLACGEWFNSEPIQLEDLKGKVVVLTLWGGFATLGPGRHRIEELNWMYRQYRDVEDVAIVGVHDNSIEPEGVAQYIDEYEIEWPVGRDMEPAVTFSRYNTQVIPQTVLIDKDGVLRFYDVEGRILELIKALRREG